MPKARDDEWMYHTTNKDIAKQIKTKGLKSSLLRLGKAVASPTGALAKDREKHELKTMFNRVLELVKTLVTKHKFTIDELRESADDYKPFVLKCSGSLEDHTTLKKIKETMLGAYVKELTKVRLAAKKDKPAAAKKPPPAKLDDMVELVQELLGVESVKMNRNGAAQTVEKFDDARAKREHYLARFGIQLASWHYMIEEAISASHIYFLKPECAKDGYPDYTKNVPKAQRVVLRVRKDAVPEKGLIDDESEGRALMTRSAVEPEDIEIIDEAEEFIAEDYRCDAKHWEPIKSWKP